MLLTVARRKQPEQEPKPRFLTLWALENQPSPDQPPSIEEQGSGGLVLGLISRGVDGMNRQSALTNNRLF